MAPNEATNTSTRARLRIGGRRGATHQRPAWWWPWASEEKQTVLTGSPVSAASRPIENPSCTKLP